MKKLMLLALSMAMSGMIFAHGGSDTYHQNNGDSEFWKEMNEIHDVIHNTSIVEKRTENGLSFEITANSESTVESIKKQFVEDQEKLESYLKNVEVNVTALDSGVEISLKSEDETLLKRLQSYGKNLIFHYLHDSVLQGKEGFYGHMGLHHQGYGPGMMYDYDKNMGFGPGMMYEEKNGERYAPESMLGNDNHMEYSHGMM